jgi:DNA-binding HxlR family transcriptional regulator
MGTVLIPSVRKNQNSPDLPGKLNSLNAECRNCTPITPFECINNCRVYQLKNELRNLWAAIDNPNYLKELFNVLKNPARIHVMQLIANDPSSLSQLMESLSRLGFVYRQDILSEEYLPPLIAVGLVSRLRNNYHITTLGNRLAPMLGEFLHFADMLPGHSECYEEALLQSLLSGPKTFEDIEEIIAPKNVSRTLSRLHSAGLITTPEARSYVFFFKTIRAPSKERITATDRKVYDAVAQKDGIPAGEIAKATGLSLRRTYKHLKKLKCKKLVFFRKTPKTYTLTSTGETLALVLQGLQQTVEDTLYSTQEVMRDNQIILETRA